MGKGRVFLDSERNHLTENHERLYCQCSNNSGQFAAIFAVVVQEKVIVVKKQRNPDFSVCVCVCEKLPHSVDEL